jgi:hypothetical protein
LVAWVAALTPLLAQMEMMAQAVTVAPVAWAARALTARTAPMV